MSVQSEIDRINGNVASTYSALSEMGATMPAQQNSDNLPGTVRTVPQGGGTSVQTDWNQTDETAPDFLQNKPFGEFAGDTLTWSINLSNLDIESLPGGFLVKISDHIVDGSALINGCTVTIFTDQIPVSPNEVIMVADGVIMISEGLIFIVDESAIGVNVDVFGQNIVFSESGMYVLVEFVEGAMTIPGYGGFLALKKMDGKYLPDTVAEQVVLYLSETVNGNYLYKDANFSEMVTVAELTDISYSSKQVMLKTDFFNYYVAVAVCGEGICYVQADFYTGNVNPRFDIAYPGT